MSTARLCVACRHFDSGICGHPETRRRWDSVVYGPQEAAVPCSSARGVGGRCGPAGKLWEPQRSFWEAIKELFA